MWNHTNGKQAAVFPVRTHVAGGHVPSSLTASRQSDASLLLANSLALTLQLQPTGFCRGADADMAVNQHLLHEALHLSIY